MLSSPHIAYPHRHLQRQAVVEQVAYRLSQLAEQGEAVLSPDGEAGRYSVLATGLLHNSYRIPIRMSLEVVSLVS